MRFKFVLDDGWAEMWEAPSYRYGFHTTALILTFLRMSAEQGHRHFSVWWE